MLSGVVAPIAFMSLPSPALAGSLVGRVLPSVFISGLALGILIAALDAGRSVARQRRARVAAALIWAGACGVAQFSIMPAIDRVRESIPGSIDSLGAVDPRRVAFDRLHSASVALLGLGMLAALVVAVLAVNATRPRTIHSH
jgi:hypothetical protein